MRTVPRDDLKFDYRPLHELVATIRPRESGPSMAPINSLHTAHCEIPRKYVELLDPAWGIVLPRYRSSSRSEA